MTSANPIQILDDDEQFEESRKQLQDQLNKHNLLKATMGNRFDIIIAVLKIDMTGTEEQKNQKIQKRIQKFFDYGEKKIDLSKHGHFFPRKEIQADAELVNNQLVIFGVDFMNTKRIKSMFPHSEPKIKWLDDSHCKLIFPDADDAKEAITRNLRDPEAYKVKMEEQSEYVPRNWFEIQPYYEMGFQRRLFCRYATNNEDQGIIKSKNYHLFLQARKKFEEDMTKQIQPLFDKEVKRLGLAPMLSKHRMASSSMRDNRNNDRSREKRFDNRRNDGNWDNDGRRNDRGFVRPDRWGGGQRRNHQNREQNNDISYYHDDRPRRQRNSSPSSISGSLRDESENYSFLLNADPAVLQRQINEEFERFGLNDGQNNISIIGKQEEPMEEIDPVAQNISLELNENLNNSMASMGRPNQEQNVSFSYSEYMKNCEAREEEERKNNCNISQIEID